MQNNDTLIDRQDYKVHFRSYSEKLYGVRVFINGEAHYIINDRLMGDQAIETLYRLKDLSVQYSEYGLIMLQENNNLYVEYDYKFNRRFGRFVLNKSEKVVNIDKYKYTLQHGIDKYKNRWDSE